MYRLHAQTSGTKTQLLFQRRGANPNAAHCEKPFIEEGKTCLEGERSAV